MSKYVLITSAAAALAAGSLYGDYFHHMEGGYYYPHEETNTSGSWGDYSTSDNYGNSGLNSGSNLSSPGYMQGGSAQNTPNYNPNNSSMQSGFRGMQDSSMQNNANYPGNTNLPGNTGMPNNSNLPDNPTIPGNTTLPGTSTSPGNLPGTSPGMSGGSGAMQRYQALNDTTFQGKQGAMDKAMKSGDNDTFTSDEDRRLGFHIRQQIAERNPSIDLSAISLYVDDGSVRITGQVKNNNEKAQISDLIKEMKGVKSVNNKLEISTKPKAPLALNENPPANPYYNQSNTYPNSTTNWENSYKGMGTTSGQNTILADKIRQAISRDRSLSPQAQSIGITISANTITLNGTVKSETEKSRVASKVRDLSEGRSIDNQLEVSPR